jgi:hypothetical protein
MFVEKYCCTRPILEDAALKTDFKVHAETSLLIVFSSLGCVVFLPMVLSNFLGELSNHLRTPKKCTPRECPPEVADTVFDFICILDILASVRFAY